MLRWKSGQTIPIDQLQQITGLSIQRPAMLARLRKARKQGIPCETLAEQIAVLSDANVVHYDVGDDILQDIPLSADATEAKRLKTVREALLIDEKRKQAEIETKLRRREVFYLDAIEPAWAAMVVAVREALRNAVPNLVDKILPCSNRNEALDRAEAELSRHLQQVSEFDLVRELNEHEGSEIWELDQ